MPYVVSTMSNDQRYTDWDIPNLEGSKVARPAQARASVLIKGKANVITKNLITPEGVITQVSDEQLEVLKRVKLFQTHVDNGSLKIMGREVAPEKAVRDMRDRDESAPLSVSKGDFAPGGRAGGQGERAGELAPVN